MFCVVICFVVSYVLIYIPGFCAAFRSALLQRLAGFKSVYTNIIHLKS